METSDDFSSSEGLSVSEDEADAHHTSIPMVPSTSNVGKSTKSKIIAGEYVRIGRLMPTLLDKEEWKEKRERRKMT